MTSQSFQKRLKTMSADARVLHISVIIKLQEIALTPNVVPNESGCTAWEEQTDVHQVCLPLLKWLYVMWHARSPSVPQLM